MAAHLGRSYYTGSDWTTVSLSEAKLYAFKKLAEDVLSKTVQGW